MLRLRTSRVFRLSVGRGIVGPMPWFEVVPLVVAVVCLIDVLLVTGLYVSVRRNERLARRSRARGRVVELWQAPGRDRLGRARRVPQP